MFGWANYAAVVRFSTAVRYAVAADRKGARGGPCGGEFGQAAAQYAVLHTGEELRGVQAVIGDPVAVGALNPGDQVAGFQSAQVVGHLPGSDGAGRESAQLGGVGPQVFVGKAVRGAPEDHQCREHSW